MKIFHISDTHGWHRQMHDLPNADIIVHSGDFTMAGSEEEAIDFLNWFCDLPYKHKIFISGNHDECLYGADINGLDNNVHYLCNSSVIIEGICFYGVPMFTGDCITERQFLNYKRIPEYTNVLITHTPPFGILDFDDNINYGSRELLECLNSVNPQLHLFGHIHRHHGIIKIGKATFSNAAIMNSDYTELTNGNLLSLNKEDITD